MAMNKNPLGYIVWLHLFKGGKKQKFSKKEKICSKKKIEKYKKKKSDKK